jgi:hypothetical protein
MPEAQLRYPEWQKPLEEAILTEDVLDRRNKIEQMRKMLLARLQIVAAKASDERQALEDGLNILKNLET